MDSIDPPAAASAVLPADAAGTWQDGLLPLMRWTLVGLTFFFFTVSCFQLFYLNQRS